MGKIYNGMDTNITESDKPKELEEIFDIINNIGSFVVERSDVKFRDDDIKRIYCSRDCYAEARRKKADE